MFVVIVVKRYFFRSQLVFIRGSYSQGMKYWGGKVLGLQGNSDRFWDGDWDGYEQGIIFFGWLGVVSVCVVYFYLVDVVYIFLVWF